jgi:hypothetical protein
VISIFDCASTFSQSSGLVILNSGRCCPIDSLPRSKPFEPEWDSNAPAPDSTGRGAGDIQHLDRLVISGQSCSLPPNASQWGGEGSAPSAGSGVPTEAGDAGYVIMRFDTAKIDRTELCVQGGLVAISAIIVAVWVLTKPIVFTYDTFTYIDVARELVSGKSTNSYYFRLPIYPTILWAFHIVDLSHSVFWLIIFQSCLAVASVWLFYLSARQLEPRGAVVVSLLLVASLLPFLHVKYIMTEQIFFFEMMLVLYGITGYLMAPSIRGALQSIVILSAGAALMMLTRPQGAYEPPRVCRRPFGLSHAAMAGFSSMA